MDIILKLPGVTGECHVTGYTTDILCTSFSFGASVPIDYSANKERTSGAANITDITLTRNADAATTALMNHLLTGKVTDTGTEIHFLKTGGTSTNGVENFITVKLTNAIVASMSLGGGMELGESLTLNFTKIDIEQKTQEAAGGQAGNITAAWDLLARSGSAVQA